MGDKPDDGTAVTNSSLADRVAALMPQLKEDLARLVAIPSVSSPALRSLASRCWTPTS